MKKAPFLKSAHYAYGGETVVASSAANHPINGLIALETGSVRSESVFPVPYKTYSIHASPELFADEEDLVRVEGGDDGGVLLPVVRHSWGS